LRVRSPNSRKATLEAREKSKGNIRELNVLRRDLISLAFFIFVSRIAFNVAFIFAIQDLSSRDARTENIRAKHGIVTKLVPSDKGLVAGIA
jgi:hypothetical protein